MATQSNYPSYLPEDFKGLPSLPDGNRRIYFRPNDDGSKTLVGEIIPKSRIVIRYPAGSTIDILPADSVGSEQIENESVEMEDLSPRVKEQMADRVSQQDLDNFQV
jgi:hypothetical protein